MTLKGIPANIDKGLAELLARSCTIKDNKCDFGLWKEDAYHITLLNLNDIKKGLSTKPKQIYQWTNVQTAGKDSVVLVVGENE